MASLFSKENLPSTVLLSNTAVNALNALMCWYLPGTAAKGYWGARPLTAADETFLIPMMMLMGAWFANFCVLNVASWYAGLFQEFMFMWAVWNTLGWASMTVGMYIPFLDDSWIAAGLDPKAMLFWVIFNGVYVALFWYATTIMEKGRVEKIDWSTVGSKALGALTAIQLLNFAFFWSNPDAATHMYYGNRALTVEELTMVRPVVRWGLGMCFLANGMFAISYLRKGALSQEVATAYAINTGFWAYICGMTYFLGKSWWPYMVDAGMPQTPMGVWFLINTCFTTAFAYTAYTAEKATKAETLPLRK